MDFGGCPHPGAMHGRFSVMSACLCGGDFAFLLPPFVDRLSTNVTPAERPGRGFPNRSRPAA
jgi:hypothetical protein